MQLMRDAATLCSTCGGPISAERLDALPSVRTCVACSTASPRVGFMVAPHKTGSFLVMVDASDAESLRRARRANRRAR
jgi:hypothetical protein